MSYRDPLTGCPAEIAEAAIKKHCLTTCAARSLWAASMATERENDRLIESGPCLHRVLPTPFAVCRGIAAMNRCRQTQCAVNWSMQAVKLACSVRHGEGLTS